MGDWEERTHELHAAAQECRDGAAELTRLVATTTWCGLSADAFRAAVDLQTRALHLTAQELEIAADLVAVHGRAVGIAENLIDWVLP